MLKKSRFLALLPLMALSLQSFPALASDASGLQAEAPIVAVPTTTTNSASVPEEKILQGEVSRHDNAEGDANGLSQNGSVSKSEGDSGLKQETPSQGANSPYELAAHKLSTGIPLSAEEFRSLGVGCFGFELYRPLNSARARVTEVYAGSPAAEAGIRRGDIVLHHHDELLKDADPTHDVWTISFDKAGTSEDVTLLKHGHPVTITLTRMNVEDIPNENIRHEWERIIISLGSPDKGAFVIPKP